MVRDLIARLLGQEGHAVDAAASLSEALAFRPADYQALVIDVRLGHERGTDLLERLRAADPTVPARCLLLTGAVDDDLPPDVAVLPKPFSADDLLTAVRRLHAAAGRDAACAAPADSATVTGATSGAATGSQAVPPSTGPG